MNFTQLDQAAQAAWRLCRHRGNRAAFRRREGATVVLLYQQHRVRIERSAHGVPSITAANEAAVYFGQGYAVAQDRLWQIDLFRRHAGGRLSEIFGGTTVALDTYHRTLRLDAIAHDTVAALEPGAAALLAAYTAGINAAMAAMRQDPLGLPVEFGLLDYAPAPWQAHDTVMVLKLMALQLSMNVKYKALTHELLKDFTVEQVGALSAAPAAEQFVTLTNAGPAHAPGAARFHRPDHGIDLKPLLNLFGQARATGSNAMVVAGKHTASGYPMLANDPHLGFSLPSMLHQAHLKCTDPGNAFEASGANAPGLPGIISGHNRHLAWGITNSQVDVQDLIALDEARRQWRYPLFEQRTFAEEIAVRGAAPRSIEIAFTPLGPLIGALCGQAAHAPQMVFAWTGLAAGADIAGLFGLVKARHWGAFRAALAHFESMSFNFLFAARDGDIGFKTVGRVPLRTEGLAHTPAGHDWTAFVPFDDLPELLNPASGIIVNGNNPIADNDFNPPLTTLWNPSYRARRLFALLDGKSNLTPGDLERMQRDVLNLHAKELLPDLLALLDPDGRDQGAAMAALRGWNFMDDKDSAAAPLWHRFFGHLVKEIYGDKFQPYLPYFENKIIATTGLIRQALAGQASPWLAGRAALARSASAALVRAAGEHAASGAQRRLRFSHFLSAGLGPLRRLTDLAPRPRAGSDVTVALNAGFPNVLEGAVWSTVIGFDAARSFSRSLLLPGQRGDFRSRWYADQWQQSAAHDDRLITSLSIH